jgi:hypothetical protein
MNHHKHNYHLWIGVLMAGAVAAVSAPAHADGFQRIDTNAVLGGAIGGGAGAAVGSAVGGRNGAIVGGALGAATGVAIATPSRPLIVHEVEYEHKHHDHGWHRGHYKHHHHDD